MTNETQEQAIRESISLLRKKADTRERVLANIELTRQEKDPRERFTCTRTRRLGDLGDYCPGYLESHKIELMKNVTSGEYRRILRDEAIPWAKQALTLHERIGAENLIEEFSGYLQDFSQALGELRRIRIKTVTREPYEARNLTVNEWEEYKRQNLNTYPSKLDGVYVAFSKVRNFLIGGTQ